MVHNALLPIKNFATCYKTPPWKLSSMGMCTGGRILHTNTHSHTDIPETYPSTPSLTLPYP